MKIIKTTLLLSTLMFASCASYSNKACCNKEKTCSSKQCDMKKECKQCDSKKSACSSNSCHVKKKS